MPEVWGKGYATEALAAILSWADKTFSSPMCCIIDEENKRSNYLAERFGFQFQNYVNYRGKPVRLLVYPSYFKLHVRWLSSLTPVTYLSKLLGITERHPVSHRRPTFGWANSFPTNLSLRLRLPATRII